MSAGRGKPVPRLALVLLALFVAAPFIAYFVPPRWWHGDFGPPPRLVTEMLAPALRPDAPPTVGMTIAASGFGTVTQAPFVLATRGPADRQAGSLPTQPIAEDVARFVRGIPRQRWEGRRERLMTCTLEGAASYRGRIVLVDGCLRFQDEGEDRPGPLVLDIPSVHRDAQGYLAVGLRGAVPEFEIRVGEPDGQFSGVGCSMDRPVAAPPAIARACGVATMRRIGTIKRKRMCSADELERIADYRRQNESALRQAEATRRACRESGTPERMCPPPPPQTPPSPNLFDCREEAPDPASFQSSHSSSRQP